MITGSEKTIIIPPMKKAKIKERKGSKAFFFSPIKNFVIT